MIINYSEFKIMCWSFSVCAKTLQALFDHGIDKRDLPLCYIYVLTCEFVLNFFLTSYQVYKARKQLTAVDWNYHINRATSMDENNEARHTRKYNQRTKEWNTRVVKVSKDFGYIPILMAKIFKGRFEDRNPIDRHVSLSEDDPARIAPTIAKVPPMPSKELYVRHQSRFSKCKTDLFSTKQSNETNN